MDCSGRFSVLPPRTGEDGGITWTRFYFQVIRACGKRRRDSLTYWTRSFTSRWAPALCRQTRSVRGTTRRSRTGFLSLGTALCGAILRMVGTSPSGFKRLRVLLMGGLRLSCCFLRGRTPRGFMIIFIIARRFVLCAVAFALASLGRVRRSRRWWLCFVHRTRI